jgi:hypothetical protein
MFSVVCSSGSSRTCIAACLVGGEGFAVDASLIEADANKQRSIAGQDWRRDRDRQRSSRAVKEYLATLDDTAWGAASDVVPKFVSPSDPAAQWTGAHKGPAFFDNYLIDVKFGVIVDVEASRSIRQAEVGAAKTMIERTEERFGLKPERLVGDTAYGAAPMLNWLVEEKGIAPHIPVFDRSKRDDGTFSRSDFRYDPTNDVYPCPGGKRLGTSGTVHEGKPMTAKARPRGENVVDLMDALRKSIGQESPAPAKSAKKTRKASAGQKEMLMPIEGKKAAQQASAKKTTPKTQRKSAQSSLGGHSGQVSRIEFRTFLSAAAASSCEAPAGGSKRAISMALSLAWGSVRSFIQPCSWHSRMAPVSSLQ